MQQRSPEWFAARVGKITGSRFAAVMALGAKGQALEARRKLVQTLALERLTGEVEEEMDNAAMQHGRDTEPLARQWIEFMHDTKVVEYGLVLDEQHPYIGVSPDGALESDLLVGVEIKCPISKRIHSERITSPDADIDTSHYWQVQGQMMVMGWREVLYVSFHPGMPPGLQGHVRTVLRNEADIKRLREECAVVHAEADLNAAVLRSKLTC